MAPTLIAVAEKYGFEPSVLAGLIYVESRWEPTAVSRSGACGLTQVIPRYVPETCAELKVPLTSIRVGGNSLNKWSTRRVRRNGQLVRIPRAGGMREALACYNAGYACLGSTRGTSYANAVLRYARRLDAKVQEVHDTQHVAGEEEGCAETLSTEKPWVLGNYDSQTFFPTWDAAPMLIEALPFKEGDDNAHIYLPLQARKNRSL